MARVFTSRFVAREGKTRLPVSTDPETGVKYLRCEKGHRILKGESYRWYAPGFHSSKRIRCMRAECTPSAGDLDASLMSEVRQAQQDANDNLSGLDLSADPDETTSAVQGIIDDVRSAVESVAGQYRDSAEAMGGAGYQMEEWADNLDGTEVMSWDASDQDTFDPDDVDECDDSDADDHARVECEECQTLIEEARVEWAEGLIEAARTVVDDIEKE